MENNTFVLVETIMHEIQTGLQKLNDVQSKQPTIFKHYQPYLNEISKLMHALIDDEFDRLFPSKEKSESQKFRDRFYAKFEGKGAYRNTDPKTSVEAAKSVNATKLENIVLGQLLSRERYMPGNPALLRGMTSEEVAVSLHKEFDCITPRFAPLLRKGLIMKSGITRKGKSGKGRIVWLLTEKGRKIYKEPEDRQCK